MRFKLTVKDFFNVALMVRLVDILLYSYFEKGCWKKCMRQSQKVLWVVLSSLLFKEV